MGEKSVRTCQKVPFNLIGFSDFPTVQRENYTKQTEKHAPDRLAHESDPIPSNTVERFDRHRYHNRTGLELSVCAFEMTLERRWRVRLRWRFARS